MTELQRNALGCKAVFTHFCEISALKMHGRVANQFIEMQCRVTDAREIRALTCMSELQIHALECKAVLQTAVQ